jgi:hypothetical protein
MTLVRRATVRVLMCLICVAFVVGSGFADTLRVVTQNALDFNGQSSASRLPYFRTTMRAIHPD